MKQNLQNIDLNLLLVFDLLMQERNLSRAAVRLHKSQPAVSNGLSRLREQLGQPLFRRTARGLEPTPEATALHGSVRQALSLLQAGIFAQESFDPDTARTFRLSMNDDAQLRLLPALMARLRPLAPRVVLQVLPDTGMPLPQRLAGGDLDLAIDYLYFDDPDLLYQPISEERLVVIGRAGHPAFRNGLGKRAYLAAQHVSILPRAGRGSPLEIVLGSAKLQRKVQLQLPHYLSIPAIVAGTELLGTIPLNLARCFARSYELQIEEFPFEISPIQVSLLWHRQQEHVSGLQWLKEQILQTALHVKSESAGGFRPRGGIRPLPPAAPACRSSGR
ncbi:MAG: LysR family transcriptional regulator [Rubrivivax sp.]